MNIEQISNVMNQFEEKFEDLDVATSTVEASIDKVCVQYLSRGGVKARNLVFILRGFLILILYVV